MPEYEKLVRDKIPDIIRANGQVPIVRTLVAFELVAGFRYKLYEEAKELAKATIRLDIVYETADLREVFTGLVGKLGLVVPTYETRPQAGGVEMMQKLRADLVACATDLATAPTRAETESAVHAFTQAYDRFLDCWRILPEEVERAQARKRAKNGGFELGLYLVDVRPR